MKELIPIRQAEVRGHIVKTVNARELHRFLHVGKDFSNWIKARIKKYGFVENQDFIIIRQNGRKINDGRGRPATEYHLTLDMAKELSMVERNEKGKQARRYFIECEKIALNSPLSSFKIPQTLSEALQLAANQARKIELDAHKVEFAETVQASSKSIKIGDYVKVISKSEGFVVGRNNFFKWLRYERILDNKNMPMQRYIDCGWFEVKERTYENKNTNGPQVTFTTLITGKGQVAVLQRFKKSKFFRKFLNKSAAATCNREIVDPFQ